MEPRDRPLAASAFELLPKKSFGPDGSRLYVLILICRWRGEDSNLRRLSRQIYSLIPLTTREPLREREPRIVGSRLGHVKSREAANQSDFKPSGGGGCRHYPPDPHAKPLSPKGRGASISTGGKGPDREVDSRGRAQSGSQSRGARNSRRNASSGSSGSGSGRYAQAARGGRDIRIDSVRPPDCRPKRVPRS